MSALDRESGSRSRFWYGRKRTVSSTSSRSASASIWAWRAPKPAMTMRRSSRSRRKVAERTRLSRSCACPTLPECMTTKRPTRSCRVAHSLSRGCGVIARVSTQFGMTRSRSGGAPFASSRSRMVSPIATIRSARRRYAPTRPRRTPITAGLLSRLSSVAISGNTSWLMTRTGAPMRSPTTTPMSPMIGGSVMQTTRSGRRLLSECRSADPRYEK